MTIWDPEIAELYALIDDVKNKRKKNFRIAQTDGSHTKTYSFSAVCVSWEKAPSIDSKPEQSKDQNQSFSGQISVS